MSTYETLADHINAALVYGELGLSEEEIKENLKEDGLTDEKEITFVLETKKIVHQECDNHIEAITEIIEKQEEVDDDEDASKDDVEKYLLEQGVNEKLIDSIYGFILFLLSQAMAQHFIQEALAEGKSDDQIKKELKETGYYEDDVLDTVYAVAMSKIRGRASSGYSPGRFITQGIVALIVGWLATDMEEGFDLLPYILYGFGILMIVFGIVKKISG